RHQPARLHVDPHFASCVPVVPVGQQAAPEVEAPLPVRYVGVVEVDGLGVHREAQRRGVGGVDDRLAGCGEPVRRLRILDRPRLVEPVYQDSRLVARDRRVERPTHPDPPVAQGEDRLQEGNELGSVFGLHQRPRVDGVDVVGELGDDLLAPSHGTSSPRSETTTSAPAPRNASGSPWRSTPTTAPKYPLTPAPTPATASSTTTHLSGWTPMRRAASRKASGAGFPDKPWSAATSPSTRTSKRSRIPAASKTGPAFFDEETTPQRTPSWSRWSSSASEPENTSTPSSARMALNNSFFLLPIAQTVPVPGSSLGSPHGSSIAREARNAATPSYRGRPSTYTR